MAAVSQHSGDDDRSERKVEESEIASFTTVLYGTFPATVFLEACTCQGLASVGTIRTKTRENMFFYSVLVNLSCTN